MNEKLLEKIANELETKNKLLDIQNEKLEKIADYLSVIADHGGY